MLVRVLKAHSNGLGDKYEKAVGDEYDHPTPDLLIARGKLEAVDDSDRQDKRVQGTRKGTGRAAAKGNGAKRAAAGGKGRARTDGGRRGKAGA